MSSPASPPNLVRRAAALLRALGAAGDGGLSTTNLSASTGVPRPTVHRVLGSLLEEGLVDRDRLTGAWHVGPELYLVGAAAARRYDVADLALPSLRRLAQSTGESAFFSARRGDETVCLIREEGSFPLRSFVLEEGLRFPLGVVSAGLVILAHLPDSEIESFLSHTDLSESWGPEHAAEAVWQRVRQTRLDGYATNPGLVVEGSWGMAAAVFTADGDPRWALTLTGVETRFTESRRGTVGRLLLDEAHRLGSRLREGTRHLSSR